MNINMYVINAVLILMVIRQIREHPLDMRSLAVPVLAVGCAAVLFLHSVPAGGNDIALELACVLAGSVMGARRPEHPAAPRCRRPAARPRGRCGGQHVDRRRRRAAGLRGRRNLWRRPGHRAFSVAHQITGPAAWVAALVMMALADVLTRLVIIYLRGRRLAAGSAVAAARIPAGFGA